MTQYIVNNIATSNTTINTDDVWIEVKAPAAVTLKVKRIRVCFGNGTATAGLDNSIRIKFMRWDTTTGGTSLTPTTNKKNANLNASTATVKGKNTTTALALGTTNVETLDVVGVNARAIYEWIARDDDDMIVVKPASCFGLVLSSGVTAQVLTGTVEWEE